MLNEVLSNNFVKDINSTLSKTSIDLVEKEIGEVIEIKGPILIARGFSKIGFEECVLIKNKFLGIVSSIDESEVKVVLLENTNEIAIGDEVKRTLAPLSVPVGESLLGRVVDGLGNAIDGLGDIPYSKKLPVERPARTIMERLFVETPMEMGTKAIDALIPVGRGQRELIMGDRQTGKTAIAIDAIINQKSKDVICIYCAIGQRDSSISHIKGMLEEHGAMEYSIMVVSSGTQLPGQQYVAPYAATSMAEYFMEQGKDVLIVYDDLTKHARAYRELSLLLERSPGREAYPGDVFYLHSRLLERSANIKPEFGGGSITSLPIIELEAENVSAYIPTNVISITDGQIVLSSSLYQKGELPAIDQGKSVSRVGSKASLAAFKQSAGKLAVEYSQFVELEMFSKFATKLDDATKKIINRGKVIRELLKQNRFEVVSAEKQVATFICIKNGIFDEIELSTIREEEARVQAIMVEEFPEIVKVIKGNKKISDDQMKEFLKRVKNKIGK